MTDAIGAILIGGDSRRMGTDKALMEVAGLPMVAWVAEALEAANLDVVTVGGPDRVAGHPNLPDPDNMHGPLAGLTAALEHGGVRPVVLVAVDQPLVRPETILRLTSVRTHDAVVPQSGGWPQVTCALYRATCLPAIRQLAKVNPDASIRDMLKLVNPLSVPWTDWHEWGEDGRSWRSIDTPRDLADLERELGRRAQSGH